MSSATAPCVSSHHSSAMRARTRHYWQSVSRFRSSKSQNSRALEWRHAQLGARDRGSPQSGSAGKSGKGDQPKTQKSCLNFYSRATTSLTSTAVNKGRRQRNGQVDRCGTATADRHSLYFYHVLLRRRPFNNHYQPEVVISSGVCAVKYD